jgi:hypothetical protein
MGSGGFKQNINKLVGKKPKVEKELSNAEYKKEYENNHKKFEQMMNSAIIDDINRIENNPNPTIENIANVIKKYDKQAESKHIKNFQRVFYQKIGEFYIQQYFLTKGMDIFKYVSNIVTNKKLDLTDEEKKDCKSVDERFQKEFDTDLKSVIIDLNNVNLNFLQDLQYKGICDDFIYHVDSQPNILTIIITPKLFEKKNLIIELGKVLQYSPQLQIVNIIINPKDHMGKIMEGFGFDGLYYNLFYKLIYGISENKNIKSLCIHSIKDYNLVLAPEISNLIIKKLQSETLTFFHFGNLIISGQFNRKFGFQLLSTRSLLFLSLHIKNLNKDFLEKFKTILYQNKSLIAVSLTSRKILMSKKEIKTYIEDVKKNNNKINLIHLGKLTFVTYEDKIKEESSTSNK